MSPGSASEIGESKQVAVSDDGLMMALSGLARRRGLCVATRDAADPGLEVWFSPHPCEMTGGAGRWD